MERASLSMLMRRRDEGFADVIRAREFAPAKEFSRRLSRVAGIAISTEADRTATPYDRMLHAIGVWEKVAEIDPQNVGRLRGLAEWHARLAHWERAAEFMQRSAAARPDEVAPRYYLATLLRRLKRDKEYRKLCQELRTEFDESADPAAQRRAIQACMWQNSGVQDYGALAARLKKVVDRVTISLHWRQTGLGIAYLRSGNTSDAKVLLEKVIESNTVPARGKVRALAALSLAYLADKDEALAHETLKRATELYAAAAPKAGSEDLGTNWHAWLICDVLLTEARTRLKVPEN